MMDANRIITMFAAASLGAELGGEHQQQQQQQQGEEGSRGSSVRSTVTAVIFCSAS